MEAHPHEPHRVEEAYAAALGRATYAFALMEWAAIACCEALDDGYIARMNHTTAGEVGEDFERLAYGIGEPGLHEVLVDAAREFLRLVRVRNALAHARPGHDAGGRCILVNKGRPWTLDGIVDAVGRFEACARRLERLLDGPLGANP